MTTPLQQGRAQGHPYWGQYTPNGVSGGVGFPNVSVAGGGLPVPATAAQDNTNPNLDNLEAGHTAWNLDTLQLFVCLDPGTPGVGDAVWAIVDAGVCSPVPIDPLNAASFQAGMVVTLDQATGQALISNPDARVPSTGNSTTQPVENAFVAAIVCSDAQPGDTQVFVINSGELTLTDWTPATGAAALIPGERYFARTNTGVDGRIVPESALGVHHDQNLVEVGEASSTTTLRVKIQHASNQFVTHVSNISADIVGPGTGIGADAGATPAVRPLAAYYDPIELRWQMHHRDRRSMDTRTSLDSTLSFRVDDMVWEKTLTSDLGLLYSDVDTGLGNTIWLEIDLAGSRLFLPHSGIGAGRTEVISGYHEIGPTPTVVVPPDTLFIDGAWVDGPVLLRMQSTGSGNIEVEVFAKPIVTLEGLTEFLDHTQLQTSNQGTPVGHFLGNIAANSPTGVGTNAVMFLQDEGAGGMGDTPKLHGTATPGSRVRVEIPGAGGRLPLRWDPMGFPTNDPELPPLVIETTAGPDGVWVAELGPLPHSYQAGWRDRHLEQNTRMITASRTYQPIVRSQLNGVHSVYVNDPYVRNPNTTFDYTQPLEHFRFLVWNHQGPDFDPAKRLVLDTSSAPPTVFDWEPENVDYLTVPYKARMWQPNGIADQPTWLSSDPAFNNNPVIAFDGPAKMLINNAPVTAAPYHRPWADGTTLQQSGNSYGNQDNWWEWGFRGHAWYWVIAIDPYTGASSTSWVIDCQERDSGWGWTLRVVTSLGVPQLRYRVNAATWSTTNVPGVGPFPNHMDGVPRLWSLRAVPEYVAGSLEAGTPVPTGNWSMIFEVDGVGGFTNTHTGFMLPWSHDSRTLAFGLNKTPNDLRTQDFRLGQFKWHARGDITDFEHQAIKAELKTKFGLW